MSGCFETRPTFIPNAEPKPPTAARKDPTIIQGSPAQRAANPPVAGIQTVPAKRKNRRKLAYALSLIALVFVAAVAFQGWRIFDAIVDAEHSAVVPWPTRDPSLAVAAAPTMTPTLQPTQAPSSTPKPSTSATSTPIPNVQVKPSSVGTATQTITGVEPTSTSVATNTTTATEQPTQASSDPTLTPTPQLAQSSGDSSGFDVLGDLIGAGTDSGDPGRSEVWAGRTSLNILIVGVDRRPDGGDQNADVLIIAHVDLINKKVAAVSLPRDLLVDIPGIGSDKINGSYNYGVLADPNNPAAGVAKVRDTIEADFGITLDGYVLIDFNGFEKVVDSVGGVDINVPYDIEDDEYPTADYGTEVVKFNKGMQHMDGETALKYVRTRHADSDDGRRERQYQVLLALFGTGKSYTSVTKADKIIVALGKSIQTSFTLEQQLTLARIGMQMDQGEIRLSALGPPLLQSGYTEDGKWVYYGDMPTIVTFVQDALNSDLNPSPAASPSPGS